MREHKDSSASWVRNPRLMTPRTRRPRWLDSLALGLHSLHHLPQSTLRALTHRRRRMCRRTRPDAQGAPAAPAAPLSDVLSRLSFPAPSLPHRNLVSQYSPRVSATSPTALISAVLVGGRRSASAAQRVGGTVALWDADEKNNSERARAHSRAVGVPLLVSVTRQLTLGPVNIRIQLDSSIARFSSAK